MRWRCLRRGNGGSSEVVVVLIASLGLGIEALTADMVTVRCSHCGEAACRARRSFAERVSSGNMILRFAKMGGSMESVQVFVVRDTRRKASLDGKVRREKRRCAAGKVGWWYSGTWTEIG